jgi:hypothetical protein
MSDYPYNVQIYLTELNSLKKLYIVFKKLLLGHDKRKIDLLYCLASIL